MRIKEQLVVLTILISTFLTGCMSDSNADNPIPSTISSVPFSIIASGDGAVRLLVDGAFPLSSNLLGGAFQNGKIEIFKDQVSLNASLAAYVQPNQPITVDFSNNQVVLIGMGGQSSSGYSVRTDEILDFPDYIKMKFTLVKPASNCIVETVITSPFEFVKVQSTKEIVFEDNLVIINCT